MRIHLIITGQSEARGRAISQLTTPTGDPQYAKYGHPCFDPIGPNVLSLNGKYCGSPWPKFCSRMAKERGHIVKVNNLAVGSSGLVQDWCGNAGGTAAPYAKDDVGFDPNSYFSDTLPYLAESGYDETWVLMNFGFNDSGDGISPANFQLAHENAVDYYTENLSTVKVAIGLTSINPSQHAIYDTYKPAIAAAIASRSNAYASADWDDVLGRNAETIFYDGAHPTTNANNRVADAEFDAFVALGW